MTRPAPDSPYSPRLLADYSLASSILASPARRRYRREAASPSTLTAGLKQVLLTTVEKALSAMGRCTTPPVPELLVTRLPLAELPMPLAERILGHLSADDLCSVALTCRFLQSCIPHAATLAAERIGFDLQPEEPQLSASCNSESFSVTRRLHTLECQAWLAARVIEKLSSDNRATREIAVLRCSSLPLAAIAHHDLALVRLASSVHVEVRLRALRTLRQFSATHTERLLYRATFAVDAVLASLNDPEDLVRRAGIAVLQAWIAPDAILAPRVAGALRCRCTDPNELVASAAYRLLEAHEELQEEDDMEDETDRDSDILPEFTAALPIC